MHKAFYIKIYTLLLICASRFCVLSFAKPYEENLSSHRIMWEDEPFDLSLRHPIFPIKKKLVLDNPPQDIAVPLEQLFSDLRETYQKISTIQGYTIQAYIGTNRQLALQAKNNIIEIYPFLMPSLYYKQPNFAVCIGRFLERLEAYPLYVVIKKIIPAAIIRPEQFPNQPNVFPPLFIIPLPNAINNNEEPQLVTETDEEAGYDEIAVLPEKK